MIQNPAIIPLSNPVGLDLVFNELNFVLTSNLNWLNYAFKHAERIEENKDTSVFSFPGLYVGAETKKDYLSLFPDDHIGNFSFIQLPDGVDYNTDKGKNIRINTPIGIIFWFDFRTVFPDDYTTKSLDNVIDLVIAALKKPLKNSGVKVETIIREPANIYQGYTHRNVDRKFTIRPYGCFRVNCNFVSNFNCAQKPIAPDFNFGITLDFDDESHAISTGGLNQDEFYYLSDSNSHGLPEGVLMQVNPSISYDNDAAATTGGVGQDEPYALSATNTYSLPAGTVKLMPVFTQVFTTDFIAATNGIQILGKYVSVISGTTGIIKLRIT